MLNFIKSFFVEKNIPHVQEKMTPSYKERQNEIKLIEYQFQIGKLVIYFSNQIEQVRVGEVVDIDFITKGGIPMRIIRDIVSGDQVLPFGIIMNYSQQKFDALNKMNPVDRISVFYFKDVYEEITFPEQEQLIDAQKWREIVLQKVEEWKKANPEKLKHMSE